MKTMHAFLMGMALLLVAPAVLAQTPEPTPNKQVFRAPSDVQAPPMKPGEKLDINTATVAQLERLPRIGPVLAQAIVNHRTTYGEFVLPEDVTQVTGIGPKLFAGITPYICADNEGTMLWKAEQPKQPKRQ